MEEKHIKVEITQKTLIEVEGKVLLVHGQDKWWEFPGGRVNDDESDLELALKREIKEELSAEITINSIFSAYLYKTRLGKQKLVILYTCTLETDFSKIKLQEGEIYNCKLFSVEELQSQPQIAGNTQKGIELFLQTKANF